jgi:hypothetical protein
MSNNKNKASKKQKVDLEHLATKAWKHYQNYLDSTEEGDGDYDELHELIALAAPHVQPLPDIDAATTCTKVTMLIPLLLSVAHYHLADPAIANYYDWNSHNNNYENENDNDKEEEDDHPEAAVIHHLTQSLYWFPANAGTWSMGANFGRTSQRLSPRTTQAWYDQAATHASRLRTVALQILKSESSSSEAVPFPENAIKEWIELLVLHQVVEVEFVDQEDDQDYDQQDDDDDEDEEKGYYSASAVEATARFMCAMLSSSSTGQQQQQQQQQHENAKEHLLHFPLTHRLHPNVWNGRTTTRATTDDATTTQTVPVSFRPKQGILPPDLYQAMLKTFAPDAAFWEESDYTSRGYYSFFSDYKNNKKQTTTTPSKKNLIEQVIIDHLLPRAQQILPLDQANQICGFEWWVHTRQVQAHLGHNLHFDTDEALLNQEGKITHPLLSSVLYLTGGGGENDSYDDNTEQEAGATIVLNQTPNAEQVADKCWKSFPQDNSLLLFPGNLLHGVLPCPGNKDNKQLETTAAPPTNPTELSQVSSCWKEPSDMPITNRLTFMVGFWTRNVPEKMEERHLYGPCGPLPPATDEHTWVKEIQKQVFKTTTTTTTAAPKTMDTVSLPSVSPAWEAIASSIVVSDEEQQAVLEIPRAIDHRFFVRGAPECFRHSLFENRGGDDDDDDDDDCSE